MGGGLMIVLPKLTTNPVADDDLPRVLVDRIPEPRLRVAPVDRTTPLDTLRITLDGPIDLTDEERDRWAAGAIELVRFCRLIDGSVRTRTLATGRLRSLESRDAIGTRSRRWVFDDGWTARLGRSIEPTHRHAATVLAAGAAGNRSVSRQPFRGRDVYVPTAAAAMPWAVGEALDTLAAYAGLSLTRALLPAELADATLRVTLDLSRPLGELLGAVCGAHGLRLRWRGVGVHGQPRIDVRGSGVAHDGDLPRARLWAARAPGARVEGTFALHPGWDAALEGQPDHAYDATQSDDFARYRNVYRRWVLNEDAPRPGDTTPVFDLTAFFGSDVFIAPQGLPFGPCLTRDPEGDALPAIVEVSLDGGTTWSRNAGGVELLRDRAGVRFTEPTLDAPFLAAAKAGALRVRVTATLRSPRPFEATRWAGNPFAGVAETRVLEAGAAFGKRWLDASSVFAADVAAGAREAEVVDDTAALRAWLMMRVGGWEQAEG
ncbi:MAG: hypothetical protein GVY24_03330 [Planctomycetes bacterium]|jgi:hypothetical protein|nr:hypothetical protein [Planctomycetota bacterium]